MIRLQENHFGWPVLALAGLLATPCAGATEAKKKAAAHPKSSTTQGVVGHRTATSTATPHAATTRSKARSPKASAKRKRRGSSRVRIAQLRLGAERTKQIQQALAQAGYLHEQPSGKWDDATHEAMRRYEADNGFTPTGLPEAKALMKLGLGPHPLPPELDASLAPRPSAEPATH